ncbi:MAG: pseudaminic acid cytidylyltransferase [Cyanobacteria bacterium TGS_CYA1]|nr:pseudaminic acid cytidylyltransferase [Cyanobacteria bacterium TGS_CYA1]
MNLAIIPARGGSKRIVHKNVKPFLGKPIISYSIEAAVSSGLFDTVMVSTDCQKIAEVALFYGADVPFMRSPETSSDHAGLELVLDEVIQRYSNQGNAYEYACIILATAPFVTVNNLKKAFDLLKNGTTSTVIPVCRFSYPVQRSLRILEDRLDLMWDQYYQCRSQDLEPAFHDVGQFYWIRLSRLEEVKKNFFHCAKPLELLEEEVQDIDTLSDWSIAEFKYEWLRRERIE